MIATKRREAVVCIESYASDAGDYQRGTRLRADHPAVRAHPVLWAPEDTTTDEMNRLRWALWKDVPVPPEELPKEPPRVQDLVVAIRDAGSRPAGLVAKYATGQSLTVEAGVRVPKNHPAVKADPKGFVPVLLPGVRPEDAMEVVSTFHWYDGEGEEHFGPYAGQLVARDDALVVSNPDRFRLPTSGGR